ncbi:cation transporter [Actinotalea ferrariae]|nr:cation diffusion facilitator family transporter [Actinotalea ferrariae]MBX9245836.1 cation transporter [Actinotalea ferrariae]
MDEHHDHDHGPDHHGHDHHGGLRGVLRGLFSPHSHDPADSIDGALESSAAGIRAVKVSLVGLGLTALVQLAIVAVTGSVALLADTVHNASDALTALPLWLAFALGRRAPTTRFTYGYGRAEDLAGLFIVAMIALSAVVAGAQSVRRLVDPVAIEQVWWVAAAGLVGFAGNEAVAVYRIRVGRRIGSAALVADGVHARTDGLTSLAVLAGALGVAAGFPLADPLVGLLITAMILVLLRGTLRDVVGRLMDGVDPGLIQDARAALAAAPGVEEVDRIRARWVGHHLHVDATIGTCATAPLAAAAAITRDAEQRVRAVLPNVGEVVITPAPVHK